jgi:hypothetical protein
LRESEDKPIWGQVEKIGKGTKANYEPAKKTLTFCFNRGPDTSGEALRASRELLMKQLKDLGYASRMKYNGEVMVENVEAEDVVLVNKNHKLVIHLNVKKAGEKEKSSSEPGL